jgi:glycosyltransferase involved in cell wall biosynthesis
VNVPQIEILLPFYGDAGLLRETVESVLAQDDPHWKLVVIDDAYPDPTAASWVGELDDERVTYLRNPVNLGVSGAFQRCLDVATGDWIVIMGGDDRMLPRFVGRMREGIRDHPDVAYLQPAVRVIDDEGRPSLPLPDRLKNHYRFSISTPTVFGGRQLTESLLRGNWMYFPATCWRREIVTQYGFQPEYEVVLDLHLQLQILADGGTMLLDPALTFEYRRHAASVSSFTAHDATRFQEEKRFFARTREDALARGWTRAARIARLHVSSRLHALARLPGTLKARDLRGARELVRHAVSNRLVDADRRH